jgi:putative N-acetyltransferase (TIGR04045 family)
MIFEPFPPFLSAGYQVKFATAPWERRGAAALRRRVFCQEQGLFGDDDRDEIDDAAIPLVAVSSYGVAPDMVVGTVRIHPAEPDIWWGSRLAVATECRSVGAIGTSLIRLAVGAAHARGCRRFFAHVQSQNVLLFQRLHWQSLGELSFHGRSHHLMQADLAQYPPIADPETGFLALLKRAA